MAGWQQITLPIDTGLGVINVPVPIDATVPISTSVPIAFDQTVNISTTVPIQLNLPVEIELGNGQVGDYLDRLYAALLDLRQRLRFRQRVRIDRFHHWWG